MGLLSADGNPLPLKLEGDKKDNFKNTLVLEIHNETDTFVFEDINEPPVPSLLRGFSAPVKLHFNYSNADFITVITPGFYNRLIAKGISEEKLEIAKKHKSEVMKVKVINQVKSAKIVKL